MIVEELYSEKYDMNVVAAFVTVEDDVSEMMSLLSNEETEKLNGFRYPKRRNEYLYSRAAVKLAVGYLAPDSMPEKISVKNSVIGAPYLDGMLNGNLRISLSHTGNMACCIVSEEAYPCGIDIEIADIKREDLLVSVMTEKEKNFLKSESDIITATIIWTAHEAVSKILMTGLTLDSFVYEVSELEYNKKENRYEGKFSMLYQYEFYSFYISGYNTVATVVYPRNSGIETRGLTDKLNIRPEKLQNEA